MTTNTGDSNLDNIIKKNFNLPIQQRRVKKEIQSLKELDQNCYKVGLQSTPLGLKIIVNLTKDFIVGEVKEAERFVFPIIFEFLLEPKFPFVFPKLLCKTNFYTPSLADGRDFVQDVIQRMWNPSIMLRDIVVFIPDFLKRMTQLSIAEETQLYGQYYLGHLYNLEDFLSMDAVTVFPASEMINEQSVNNERFLMITESFFLNFESVDKVRNTLRLIGWAHVHSIARIKKNRDNEKMLVFLWHDSNQRGILVQNVFVLDQAKELVDLLTQLGQKYAEIAEELQNQRDLPLSEVTAKNYRDMDITELLESILYLESRLEAELNIDNINLLMNLYQKAVEYYSALNDPNFSEYIQKLHDLLARQDIQTILNSTEGKGNNDVKVSKQDKIKSEPKKSHQSREESREAQEVKDSNSVQAKEVKNQIEEKREEQNNAFESSTEGKENQIQESESKSVNNKTELNVSEEQKIKEQQNNAESDTGVQVESHKVHKNPEVIPGENQEDVATKQELITTGQEENSGELTKQIVQDSSLNKEEETKESNTTSSIETTHSKPEGHTNRNELKKEDEHNGNKNAEQNIHIKNSTKESQASTITNTNVTSNDDMFDIGDDDD